MRFVSALSLAVLGSLGASHGAILSSEVRSPEECGENLRVETRSAPGAKGLIAVTVTFTPAVPALYRGRATAFGELAVKQGNEIIAVSPLESTERAGAFQFTFQLARASFSRSELTLSSVLHEASGEAIVGGGERWRLHLGGFQPGATGAP